MDCSLPGSSVRGNFPGKNTGVGCHFLLQGIFLTCESNLCLLHLLGRFFTVWATREAPQNGDAISLYLKGLLYDDQFSSVQFSDSVASDSSRPHESQHARPPCPSPTPRVHSNSCPSSQWCHPAISSSVIPFSSCPQSLPASEFFQWVNSSHEVAKVLEFQL